MVVLPLVPVTDTTGTLGLFMVKRSPGSACVTAPTALVIAPSWTASAGSISSASTGPRCCPSASPRPRQRHGNATTTSAGDPPVRTRTPSLVVPEPAAIRRTTCARRAITAR